MTFPYLLYQPKVQYLKGRCKLYTFSVNNLSKKLIANKQIIYKTRLISFYIKWNVLIIKYCRQRIESPFHRDSAVYIYLYLFGFLGQTHLYFNLTKQLKIFSNFLWCLRKGIKFPKCYRFIYRSSKNKNIII